MKRKFPILAALSLTLLAPAAGAVDLMGVFEMASRNDAEFKAAERRLEAREFDRAIARSSFLPQASGTLQRAIGTARPERDGESLENRRTNTENYGVQITQSIYDDANFGRMNRARASIAQANAQFNVAWQDFLLRNAQRYFDMLTAIDTLRFAEAEETALRRQFEQAEQRFEVGLSAVTDFLEARAAWDGARARVIVAENDLEDAREALRELTGTMFEAFRPLEQELPLNPPSPADPQDWVRVALDTNPDLLAARQAVEVADADVRIARAGHLPTLDLTGNLNRNINNSLPLLVAEERIGTATLEADAWQLNLLLNIPIFSGLAVQSQTRQARANRRVATEELDFNQRQVVRRTENAYRAIMAGIRQVQALEQALISAESALEATNAGFEVGTRTIVDVLLAEQRFFQAQRDHSRARHQFIIDNLSLRRAAGTLTPEDLEAANRLLSGEERG